eukprot:scaffold127607_cov42-Attheya_sp.AAC.1
MGGRQQCRSGCGEPPAYGRLDICGELARFSTTTGRTVSTCGKLSTAVVQGFLPSPEERAGLATFA